MTITGHRMAIRYQSLLQNHNIGHDLIPREFGKGRAYIIGCTASGPSRSRSQQCLERTAPLRPRMTRTSGLGA